MHLLEVQCIQLQVCCDCSENAFHFEFEEKKVLTLHGHVFVTLVSWITYCLRLVFAAARGDLKKKFLLYPFFLLFEVLCQLF